MENRSLNRYIGIFRYCFLALTITYTSASYAQVDSTLTYHDIYQPYLNQSFLIVASSKSYQDAKRIALKAEKKLNIDFPSSIYFPDKIDGLKTDIACGCGEIHDYFPRGSHDNGNYVSIEYSSGYDGFSEGYYIVIVSSGAKNKVENELPNAQKYFKQAYIKSAQIYVGCRH